MSEMQFNTLLFENKVRAFTRDHACCLLVEDNGFTRFFFIVSHVEEIKCFLTRLVNQVDGEVVTEIVGDSNYLLSIRSVFLTNGFYEYSSMVRMSKIRTELSELSFDYIFPLKSDKKTELQVLYNNYFDKFVERIPTSDEIDHFIINNNVYYFSDSGEIQGFIIFEQQGSTMHLRYWFVHPQYRGKGVGSKLMNVFLSHGNNVRRELFWVIESNVDAIKKYKHYGFAQEDMRNLILINKEIKYEEPDYSNFK